MNTINIQRTTFIDHPSQEKSIGYRYYDDYASGYQNFETESIFAMDDLTFLAHVRKEAPEALREMLSFAAENEKGVYIDGKFYDWDEVNVVLDPADTAPVAATAGEGSAG